MLSRYLTWEVMKPTLVVLGILVALFAGYSWVSFLASAANALLPVKLILALIGLKIVIALEVLLPVSLYLGIILGFGRLYTDSEVKALMAGGISPYRVVAIILVPICVVAIAVALLSLSLRPWAYGQSYQLKAEAESGFRISNLNPGHFYERREGSLVFYAEALDAQRNRLKGVFVQSESENGETLRVISAKEAKEKLDPKNGTALPLLFDGYEYQITRDGDIKHISGFSQLTIYPKEVNPEFKRKAESTSILAKSQKPSDAAEIHWRFSTPFSAILLGLLGIPLSRSAPRQGKYAKIFTAILIFAVYYFISVLMKSLVEQGHIPSFPGLWAIVGTLGVLVMYLFSPSRFTKTF